MKRRKIGNTNKKSRTKCFMWAAYSESLFITCRSSYVRTWPSVLWQSAPQPFSQRPWWTTTPAPTTVHLSHECGLNLEKKENTLLINVLIQKAITKFNCQFSAAVLCEWKIYFSRRNILIQEWKHGWLSVSCWVDPHYCCISFILWCTSVFRCG